MSCQQCGAPCQGGLCRQCEVENAHAHLADELASDDDSDDDSDDSPGHGNAVLAQLRQAERDGDLPAEIAARHEEVGGDE